MSKTATAVQPVTDANLWSEYAIEAHSSLTDQPLRSLKHGDAFAVVNGFGDIEPLQDSAQGLFYCDTRFLSQFEMRLEGKKPLLLGSAMHDNKSALTVELTNPDVLLGKDDKLPKDTIFLTRTTILRDGASYERIGIRNFGSAKRRLRLDFLYAADFHDLFEIRGTRRHRRGTLSSNVIDSKAVRFKYRGLDKIERTTLIQFDPRPVRLASDRAMVEVEIVAHGQTSIFITVLCLESNAQEATQIADYFRAYRETRRERRQLTRRIATLATSNEAFEEVVSRATSDVYTLVTATPHGLYPYAGIPWFNTVFGRDGIITAMLMLWMDPSLAQGVLLTLAATQA
ncbi:MAG TPA: glycogen debranching N-terminal domain-containing protein, partial [Bradyrhizobium sp.]|uniref:glycogen debranching N-terminal domain-containing protein n=1 Tax=Bradyrhizobium sp. TaxID=376 RepID=UPI002B47E150